MDLKELLGEELYATIEPKLTETKAKFVDLTDGQYVDKAKHTALKTQFEELTGKVKQFDGVDIDGLKKSAVEWENKYNTEVSKLKMDYEIDRSLSDAKNPKAVKALLDLSIVKLENDKLLGLEEQLKGLRETDPYLFKIEEPKAKGVKIGTDTTAKDDTLAKMMAAAGVRPAK